MKDAKELKEPYVKALRKIGKQLKWGDMHDASVEANVSIPTLQLALNGNVQKFETAERVINWGIKKGLI